MAYVKTTWVNGVTPINSNNLNNIENGIETNETSINGLIGTILWTNPSPNSDFDLQSITLNSNDYEILEVYFRSDVQGNRMGSVKVLKGYTLQCDMSSDGYATPTRRWVRRLIYVSDTEYSAKDCTRLEYGENVVTTNDQCVPLYIIGYKTGLI